MLLCLVKKTKDWSTSYKVKQVACKSTSLVYIDSLVCMIKQLTWPFFGPCSHKSQLKYAKFITNIIRLQPSNHLSNDLKNFESLAKKKKKIIFTTMINGRLTTYMKKEKVINQPSLKTYGVITNERAKVKEKNDKKNKKREWIKGVDSNSRRCHP